MNPSATVLLALLLTFSLLTVAAAPLAAQEPRDAQSSLDAAVAALASGDLDAAEAGFREAVRLDPSNERAWLGLSGFQAARGELVEALQSARRADRLAPDQPITLLTIARLQAALGGFSAALRTLDRALELPGENVGAWLLSAIVLRDMGRVPDAIERLERARASGLEQPVLIEELGLLLLSQERPAEALELAQEALAAHPESGRLHLVAGLALARDSEQRDTAIGHLERALQTETGYPERIRLELSSLLVAVGRPAEALEHLEVVERTRATDPELHYRMGLALQAAGDAEGARAALERFKELERIEGDTEATAKRLGTQFNEAQQLAAENRLTQALAKIDALLEERPAHARTLALRGKILFSMNRVPEALASMSEARRLDPGRLEHAYLEGLFLLTLGRAAEAQAAALRAIAIDSEAARAYELLGLATARQKKHAEAAVHFQRALDLGLDTVTLRLNYANVLESLGRTDEFERQMDAYRRLKAAGGEP